METNNELEIMRGQMAALKDELSRQQIVNKSVLQRAVRHNVSSLKLRSTVWMVAVCLSAVLIFCAARLLLNLPLYFAIASVLIMVVAVLIYLNSMSFAYNPDLMSGDLISTAEQFLKWKKTEYRWPYYGIPIGLAYIAWFGRELSRVGLLNGETAIPLAVGACVGLVIGGIFGLSLRRKILIEIDDILDQIEQLKRM